MKKAAFLASCLMLTLPSSSAFPADGYSDIFSELRLGLLYHDPDHREEGSVDIQTELLLNLFGPSSPDADFWTRLATPRPHFGVTINTVGDTSYGNVGLTWNFPIYGPLFIEGTLGGAIHNGELDNTNPNHEPLGSRLLFRESASLGYQIGSYSLLIGIEHLSNAGLSTWNHGLTNVGARIGYQF